MIVLFTYSVAARDFPTYFVQCHEKRFNRFIAKVAEFETIAHV